MKKQLKPLLAILLSLGLFVTGCSNATKTTDGNNTNDSTESPKYRITGEANEDIAMFNAPESPYWFPNELMEWDAANDPNFDFYKANVPLAKRVNKENLNPINSTQNKDFEVINLSIMNSSTSGNSPHGLNRFGANTFSYWQYVDKLVYWGGSSGEGLIVAPSADVIDSAHRNGVPVLGTIFFPMAEHGGKIQWLNDFLMKDANGNFPIVDKLIDTATVLGFDGWFFNQESQGTEDAPLTKEHADLTKEFLKQFREKAGDTISLVWYDSMTEEGKMDWQNALNEKNDAYMIEDGKLGANNMFLNFWWTTDKLANENLLSKSKDYASSIGVNPYNIYAGIDVQAAGVSTPIKWNLFAKDNVPYTSLGLYCPSWAYFAAENLDEYEGNESRLWVNEFSDPSQTTKANDSTWHGVSTYAIEKTVVNSLPFTTNFNLGNGYNFFIDGEKVSSLDWNNRSMMDIMPTYRWSLNQEEGNKLKPNFDYATAYYGGNSIRLYGEMVKDASSKITLYSSDLAGSDKLSGTVQFKADHKVTTDLVLTYEDGQEEIISGKESVKGEWSEVNYDLSKTTGKTIKTIGLKFTLKEDSGSVQINIGSLSLTEDINEMSGSVSEVKLQDFTFDEEGLYTGIKLNWSAVDGAAFYEVYKIYDDGTKSFMGVTTATSHYIHALQREENEEKSVFEVIPVNQYQNRGTGANVAMEWPNNKLPKSDFSVSKTLCAPGESIQFTSLSSANTTEWEWKFDGADTPSSTEENPTVTYSNEGTYNVTLTARNAEGSVDMVMDKLIVISKDAQGDLPLLSQGADATASSYVNENESPQFAIDGNTDTKWCATGPSPHSITFDLKKSALVSEVSIAHAEAGGENPDMNTMWYTIETSEDGTSFQLSKEIKKNKLGETLDTFKPTNARYVRITAVKPTQGSDSAVRIYEIQVHGTVAK